MDSKHQDIARRCLEGAESGTMTFPEIVGTLTAGAFDGYLVDLRLSKATIICRTAVALICLHN